LKYKVWQIEIQYEFNEILYISGWLLLIVLNGIIILWSFVCESTAVYVTPSIATELYGLNIIIFSIWLLFKWSMCELVKCKVSKAQCTGNDVLLSFLKDRINTVVI
jgi:hypothetical protein